MTRISALVTLCSSPHPRRHPRRSRHRPTSSGPRAGSTSQPAKSARPRVIVIQGGDRERRRRCARGRAGHRPRRRHVLPGLLDAHTHLTSDIDGDWVTRSVRELPADAASRGAATRAGRSRRASPPCATSARAASPTSALMKAIDARHGPGPADHARRLRDRHHRRSLRRDRLGARHLGTGPEQGIVDGPDAGAARRPLSAEARRQGDQDLRDGRRALVRGHRRRAAALGRGDEAVVDEAARHGVKVAAHAHGSEGILAAVKRRRCLDRARLDADRRDHRADEEARHLPRADRLPAHRDCKPVRAAAAHRCQGAPDHSTGARRATGRRSRPA